MICPPCSEAVDGGHYCKNCRTPIVFQPYFRDGKEPNPPVWWHPPGSTTCSVPDNPPGEPWPVAEPMDGHPAEICRDFGIQPAGCPCQHKPVHSLKETTHA